MKASKLFTKKKDLKTNHKGVHLAEPLKSSREITIEAMETDTSNSYFTSKKWVV